MAQHFDFVDIRLLIHIAESGSMSKGAERTCLSPPAATNRIKSLEDAYGVQLLYRKSQGVTLTPAGQTFLQHARVLMAGVDKLNDEMKQFTQGLTGHVRLWVNTTALGERFAKTLGSFMAEHPDVTVELRERLSHEVARAVDEGSADIGIIAGDIDSERLALLPYGQDRLVVVVPKSHAAASQPQIAFRVLLDYDQVSMPESSAIHRFLMQAALAMGRRFTARIEVGSFENLCRLVEANVGIGVAPESVARRYAQSMQICIVPLEDAWARRLLRVCVRSRETLPSYAQALVEALLASADDFQQGELGVQQSSIVKALAAR
jgi:DNA-binding transcriptional LysR family regulator